MAVKIIRRDKSGKATVKVYATDPLFGVKAGQIYLIADGSLHGVFVQSIDAEKSRAYVRKASPQGWGKHDLMDLYQMAQVSHYLAGKPDWWPTS